MRRRTVQRRLASPPPSPPTVLKHALSLHSEHGSVINRLFLWLAGGCRIVHRRIFHLPERAGQFAMET
jgi:hypothetical protein